MHDKSHWESVYKNKKPDEVNWFQPHLNKSLDLILKSGIGEEAQIIDAGGGASTLVDDLLNMHFKNITVVDVSAEALNKSKQRLGNLEGEVTWIEANVTKIELPGAYYDLWHDRALFHFFTEQRDRQAYIKSLSHSLKPGGYLVLSTFSLKGPEQCSGLDVVCYDAGKLLAELGPSFKLIETLEEEHQTPFGKKQSFAYFFFRRC